MNKLKAFSLIVLFCTASFAFATQSMAQQANTPKLTNEQKIATLKSELKLTDKQVAKVTAVYKDQESKLVEVKTSGIDKAGQVLKRREIWKSTDDQIAAILTPEQTPKWESLKAEWKAVASHRQTKPTE